MPAPVAEVTVYGYVGAHLHYAFDGQHGAGNSFSVSTLANTGGDHISLTAKQSRFGIKSKIDTAIGQIRTQIEADFNTGGNAGSLPSASASRSWSLGHDPELDLHGWPVLVHRGPAADRRIHR
jgi:hypothetical protein